jgi:hypothetical protein
MKPETNLLSYDTACISWNVVASPSLRSAGRRVWQFGTLRLGYFSVLERHVHHFRCILLEEDVHDAAPRNYWSLSLLNRYVPCFYKLRLLQTNQKCNTY